MIKLGFNTLSHPSFYGFVLFLCENLLHSVIRLGLTELIRSRQRMKQPV